MSDALNTDQARDLTAVLDTIIPESQDGALPGAGALGLTAFIEQKIAESPDLGLAIVQGLGTLDSIAGERGAASFAEVAPTDRAECLNDLTTREPAFLPGLIFQTYIGYYQHPRVVEGLGVEGRPPFPLGYTLDAMDEGLVEPVRSRGPVYRRP